MGFSNLRVRHPSNEGTPNLIKRASDRLNNFRNARYEAGIILLDADREPCVTAIRSKFSVECRVEFQLGRDLRFLHLVVAKKKLESWLLADTDAVRQSSGNSYYSAVEETSTANYDHTIRELYGDISKVALAGKLSSRFDPPRGSSNSESFSYYTNLLNRLTQNH